MQGFIDLLKEFAHPSGVSFLVAALAVAAALAWGRRTQRVAKWYVAMVLVFYWLVSVPVVIEPLLRREQARYPRIDAAGDARGARTIVVLGAGNSTVQGAGQSLNLVTYTAALRLLEGARLYRLLDRPTVIVSGGVTGKETGARSEGDAMRRAILELGVPDDHIVIETESKTTRDEAIVIARMLAGRPRGPIVLVTAATHMPRALAVFRAAGLEPIPAVAPFSSDHSLERRRWLPSNLALLLFDTMCYDAAATWYYWLRGWLAA